MVSGLASEKVAAKIGKESAAIQTAEFQYSRLIPSESFRANSRAAAGLYIVAKQFITSLLKIASGTTTRNNATVGRSWKYPSSSTAVVCMVTVTRPELSMGMVKLKT